MAGAREFHYRENKASHAPILTPEESRQGVISGRVLTILAASLSLAFVAFVVLIAATA